MLILHSNGVFKIISQGDLWIYKNDPQTKIIGTLQGDYPSLKSLEVKKKTVAEFLEYLDDKIKDHNRLLHTYKIQLKQFKGDLAILGVEN